MQAHVRKHAPSGDALAALEATESELLLSQQLAASRLDDVHNLKMELVRVETQRKSLREERAQLKALLQASEKENSKLRSNVAVLRRSLSSTKAKLKAAQSAKAKAFQQHRSAEEKSTRLTVRVEELAKQATEAKALVAELRAMGSARTEALERHYAEKIGSLSNALEIARNKTFSAEQASSSQAEQQRGAEQRASVVAEELNACRSLRNADARAHAAGVKRERAEHAQLAERLAAENHALWQQVQFLEASILEEALESSGAGRSQAKKRRAQLDDRVGLQNAVRERGTKISQLKADLRDSVYNAELLAGRLSVCEERLGRSGRVAAPAPPSKVSSEPGKSNRIVPRRPRAQQAPSGRRSRPRPRCARDGSKGDGTAADAVGEDCEAASRNQPEACRSASKEGCAALCCAEGA